MPSNKLTTIALLFFSSCQLNVAQAFLPSWLPGVVPTSPDLNRYTAEVTSSTFDCRLNIGLPGHGAVFPINDFQFRLCKGAGTDEERVALPGSDGPRPHLSSGPHRISTLTEGSYITMEGAKVVPLMKGAWELIWRADSQCGFLICGFNLERDVRRNENGAVLPKGNIYVTFPVWSKNGLKDEQLIKKNVEAMYKQYENEVEDQLKKYNEENNLLKKAMHFRNAVQADVDKDNLSAHLREDVPNNDDVVEIGPCLQLVKTGTIWAKMGSFKSNTHTLLGSAVVRTSDGVRA
mmetsp:Transcript_10555/g.15093  ORF Transcript_10555/g.15093 Transcript_10555/m.15093 type:complete len:291 (-) Transcript_10555:133-1005(-)